MPAAAATTVRRTRRREGGLIRFGFRRPGLPGRLRILAPHIGIHGHRFPALDGRAAGSLPRSSSSRHVVTRHLLRRAVAPERGSRHTRSVGERILSRGLDRRTPRRPARPSPRPGRPEPRRRGRPRVARRARLPGGRQPAGLGGPGAVRPGDGLAGLRRLSVRLRVRRGPPGGPGEIRAGAPRGAGGRRAGRGGTHRRRGGDPRRGRGRGLRPPAGDGAVASPAPRRGASTSSSSPTPGTAPSPPSRSTSTPASRPGRRPTWRCRGSATGAGRRMSAARPATSASSAAPTAASTRS